MSRRVVLITGASTGIGAAAALALAEAGFEVLAGVRDEGAGERLRAAAADGAITPIRLDVT
ncbi:MAG: SDR family NAD(P)-dependent oxidoreductase, partial [Myxococcales bacterium]|nr:SDR family NAD(P)-dependent oxidoreductase [Myxococcales bacterium]